MTKEEFLKALETCLSFSKGLTIESVDETDGKLVIDTVSDDGKMKKKFFISVDYERVPDPPYMLDRGSWL